MSKRPIAVLISGRGSNLEAIASAARDISFPAEVKLVVSNNPDAAGLGIARRFGIEQLVIDSRRFGAGEAARGNFEEALDAALRKSSVELVCLAGFMRLLSEKFVEAWRGKLINIHPSLLPAFKGLDAHRRMIEAGVKIAGCTVHFVTADTDSGPIVGQAAVPVLAGDDADALAVRILAEEHRLYPECIRRIVAGEALLTADGVVRLSGAPAHGALRNP